MERRREIASARLTARAGAGTCVESHDATQIRADMGRSMTLDLGRQPA
ncbi:hypothetical protein FM110_06290 [Brachybacterium nesterenkovii]|uniref:Uncharacterized protein n=1 Tax=Brachybacterium nesterenkovii TaxID=47847 RepID=A0A1X6WZ12_9MICO|nr:hypothetical protein FM110_06290 [Brachybacterium nesterenkovii]